MKVILAVTGASGAIYARQCAERLLGAPDIEQIALIVSDNGRRVMEYEGERLPESDRIVRYDNSDMFCPAASASARFQSMNRLPPAPGPRPRR